MPKKRCSDEQIVFAVRQAEAGTTIGEICRKMRLRKRLDLSRFGAAPSARLNHLSLEGDGAFPAQC